MTSEGIIEFLENCKKDLIEIKNKDYEEVEKRLLPYRPLVSFDSDDKAYYQSHYERYVNDAIEAIDIIKKENELFGFEDFTPIKEKIETEVQLGSDKLGALWRRKKTS